MGQMIKWMVTELTPGRARPETTAVLSDMEKHLESVKWYLWHGNVPHALERIDDLDDDLRKTFCRWFPSMQLKVAA